jgi:hypothetical protein
MPRYYFDIKNGHRLIDPAGLDCADDADAITKAKMIAIQISRDAPRPEGQRHIAVMSPEGQEVSKVPVYSERTARPAE